MIEILCTALSNIFYPFSSIGFRTDEPSQENLKESCYPSVRLSRQTTLSFMTAQSRVQEGFSLRAGPLQTTGSKLSASPINWWIRTQKISNIADQPHQPAVP